MHSGRRTIKRHYMVLHCTLVYKTLNKCAFGITKVVSIDLQLCFIRNAPQDLEYIQGFSK